MPNSSLTWFDYTFNLKMKNSIYVSFTYLDINGKKISYFSTRCVFWVSLYFWWTQIICFCLIIFMYFVDFSNGRLAQRREITPVFSESIYRSCVIPELYKAFCCHEINIRTLLLKYFPCYVDLFDKEKLEDIIFPQVITNLPHFFSKFKTTIFFKNLCIMKNLHIYEVLFSAQSPCNYTVFFQGPF